MKTQKILIIGGGFWGKNWLKAVTSHKGVELAGIVDTNDDVLREIAGQFNIAKKFCYNNIQNALADSGADIVAVVVPPARHLPVIRLGMEAGKHVICEKPLAESDESARAIAEIVRARPIQKFMVSQTRRFTNQVATIKDFIDSGRLGAIDTILFDHRVNYTGGGYRQRMDYPILEDMITHHLDGLRYITGQEPVSVYVESWNPSWSQFTGKASNNMLVTMTGGLHVNYHASWTSRGQVNSYDGLMKIVGSKGSLELSDGHTLFFYPYTGAEQQPDCPEAQGIPMIDLHDKEIHGVINACLHALGTNTVPPCNIEDNLKTFAFNCAVLESGKTDTKKNLSLGRQFNSALIPVPKLEEDCYDWHARHEAVLRTGRKINPEIVLIGDSLTHFWGGEPASEIVRGPISWQATFGKYRTLNMGFGWDRIQNVLWRLEHGEFNGLAPRLVILNVGINNTSETPNARRNTPEEIAEGLSAICCRLRKCVPNLRIIVMGLFPGGQYATDERRPLVDKINHNIAIISEKIGVTFIDIGHLFLEPDGSISREIMLDFIHPTEKGYMLWAQAISPFL